MVHLSHFISLNVSYISNLKISLSPENRDHPAIFAISFEKLKFHRKDESESLKKFLGKLIEKVIIVNLDTV